MDAGQDQPERGGEDQHLAGVDPTTSGLRSAVGCVFDLGYELLGAGDPYPGADADTAALIGVRDAVQLPFQQRDHASGLHNQNSEQGPLQPRTQGYRLVVRSTRNAPSTAKYRWPFTEGPGISDNLIEHAGHHRHWQAARRCPA